MTNKEILGCLILHCYWSFQLPRSYLSIRFHVDRVSKVLRHLFIVGSFDPDVIMQLLAFVCHLLLLFNNYRLS